MGESLPSGMLAAARDGDVEGLLTFLDDGVSANAGNVIGQTAMHIASIWGHVDAVDALLDAGANPNQENDDGLPPLYFAVRNNRLSVVRLLLDRGAVIRDLDRLLKVAEEEAVRLRRALQEREASARAAETKEPPPAEPEPVPQSRC